MSNVMKSGEVANRLGIDGVTLRKYSYALEDFDYKFRKNGQNRIYTEKDFEIISMMRFLVRKGMTRKDAAETVLNRFGILSGDDTLSEGTDLIPNDNNDLTPIELYEERLDVTEKNVQKMIREQENEVKAYFDSKFDEQNNFFARKFNETWQEREKNLQINQVLQTSKQFAAAVEEETQKRIKSMGFGEKLKLLFKK